MDSLPDEIMRDITLYLKLSDIILINKSIYDINKIRYRDNFKLSQINIRNYNSNNPMILYSQHDGNGDASYYATQKCNNEIIYNISIRYGEGGGGIIFVDIGGIHKQIQSNYYSLDLSTSYDIIMTLSFCHDMKLFASQYVLKRLTSIMTRLYYIEPYILEIESLLIDHRMPIGTGYFWWYAVIELYIELFTSCIIFGITEAEDLWTPFNKNQFYLFTNDISDEYETSIDNIKISKILILTIQKLNVLIIDHITKL